MREPVQGERPIADIIFEMEEAVADVQRWALTVIDLGQCENDVKAAGLYVVGQALERVAASLHEQWSEAFRLSRSPEQRARL